MAISVGSVSVDVVPSARHFSRDLQAQLADQNVAVRAKLDDKGVRAELTDLSRDRETKLDVVVDDRAAKAKLDKLTRPRTAKVKVDDGGSIEKTDRKLHGLLTTAIALAPAVAPVAGVALAGAVALGGLGAAGILAVRGIQAEMAKGTPIGLQYSGMLGTLKTDLAGLEQTAASGVLDGFTASASDAHAAMPALRSEVGFLARSLGSDLGPATSGALGLLHDLDPVINELAGDGHRLAVSFDEWANGPGGRQFAAYLAQELPVVERDLEAVVQAGAHVVQALLPLGGVVLDGIDGLANGIKAIPLPIIEDLFVAFLGYKSIVAADVATQAFTKTLQRLGVMSVATGTKLDGLAVSETVAARAAAGGGAAAGAGKGIGLLGAGGLAARGAAALGGGAVLGVGGAIVGGVGVGVLAAQLIDQHQDSANTQAANNLISGGQPAIAAAQQQLAALNAQIAARGKGLAQQARNGGISQGQALSESNNPGGITDLRDKAATLTTVLKLAQAQMKKNAAQNIALGLTADGTRDAITGETVAMSVFIAKQDKAISVAQALISTNISQHQALADANAALKQNGATLDLNTAKGRANQTALLGLASALHQKIDADAAAHVSQGKANADFATAQDELYGMARRFGLSSTAAQRYADKLLGIPSDITTRVTINGIGAAQAQIKALIAYEGQAQFTAHQRAGDLQPTLPGQKKPKKKNAAAGVLSSIGGVTEVGEFGRELAYLEPRGAIVPQHIVAAAFASAAMQSQANSAAAGAGGWGRQTPPLQIGNVTVKDVDEMARVLTQRQRDAAVLYALSSGI